MVDVRDFFLLISDGLLQNDSGYLTGKRKNGSGLASGKENVLPNKRVRKALAPAWASTSSQDMSFAVETPVSRISSPLHNVEIRIVRWVRTMYVY